MREPRIEVVVFLRVVPPVDLVAEFDFALVRRDLTSKDPQQRGLPRTVQSEDENALTTPRSNETSLKIAGPEKLFASPFVVSTVAPACGGQGNEQ